MEQIEGIHYTPNRKWRLKNVHIRNHKRGNYKCVGKKPWGGIWLSPVGSKWGWKEWCDDNSFRDLDQDVQVRMTISLQRAHIIDNYDDMLKLPWMPHPLLAPLGLGAKVIDFESLKRGGVDVVYLTDKGQSATHMPIFRHIRDAEVSPEDITPFDMPDLYGWDCESLLVMSKRAVKDWRVLPKQS